MVLALALVAVGLIAFALGFFLALNWLNPWKYF